MRLLLWNCSEEYNTPQLVPSVFIIWFRQIPLEETICLSQTSERKKKHWSCVQTCFAGTLFEKTSRIYTSPSKRGWSTSPHQEPFVRTQWSRQCQHSVMILFDNHLFVPNEVSFSRTNSTDNSKRTRVLFQLDRFPYTLLCLSHLSRTRSAVTSIKTMRQPVVSSLNKQLPPFITTIFSTHRGTFPTINRCDGLELRRVRHSLMQETSPFRRPFGYIRDGLASC